MTEQLVMKRGAMAGGAVRVYLCPRHLIPQEKPGQCSFCDLELIECRPGDPDDPCRRPVVDEQGRVRSRAPLWWLEKTVGALKPYLDSD